MASISKIMLMLTVWLLFGGMLTLAIIFDGIYIQITIDTAIILISGLIGYITRAKSSKEET